jgi:SAM-dependent methyltransferase
MTSSPRSGLPFPTALKRSAYLERQEWIDSGKFAVELLCRTMARSDLDGIEILDVGCGTKIVQTLLDNSLPVGRYVGIDVSDAVIDWLNANVRDRRFEFHHFDARNDLYNPRGTPLAQFQQLPVGQNRFDLICLFSVFTHLDPDDYVAMLGLLRRHVKEDGRLLFSLFMTDPPSSVWTQAFEAALASEDPTVVEQVKSALARRMAAEHRGFLDAVPDRPLLKARYERDFALKLIEGTGWEVMSVNPPERYIQHYIVCRPG